MNVTEQSKGTAGLLSRLLTPLLVAGLVGGLLYMGVLDARSSELLAPSETAPAFEFKRYQGGSVSLHEQRGKVVMLDFWATWCAPCVREMPILVKLAQEYRDEGLVFIAANRDEPDTARAAVQGFISRRLPALAEHVAYADVETAMRYRVQILPTLYFIDREGRVSSAYAGAESESTLRRWVEEALAKSP